MLVKGAPGHHPIQVSLVNSWAVSCPFYDTFITEYNLPFPHMTVGNIEVLPGQLVAGNCSVFWGRLPISLLSHGHLQCAPRHDDSMTWKRTPHYWPIVRESSQEAVMRIFVLFFVHMNELLNKQSCCWWRERPCCSCDVIVMKWELWLRKQVFQAWISNFIQEYCGMQLLFHAWDTYFWNQSPQIRTGALSVWYCWGLYCVPSFDANDYFLQH